MATLLFFGPLADIAGSRIRAFSPPTGGCEVSAAIDDLEADAPELAAALRQETVRVAINAQIVDLHSKIFDDEEVAFLPPASGG